MKAELGKIVLKEAEEARLQKGEFWIYDNEIQGDFSHFAKGELVQIHTSDNRFIATGYANPFSKITCRILSRDPQETIDRVFFSKKIQEADRQRRSLAPDHVCYRMVYGEADFLPGLVVDRFDDYFIVQITTAGIENFKSAIFSIIEELYPGATVIEKSLTQAREKENLDIINRVVTPNRRSEKIIPINGVKFKIDFLKSQKTGFFLDQKENYLLLRHIAQDKDVLDVFSYTGAWGLHAMHFGARSVELIEISNEYLAQAEENRKINQLAKESFVFTQGDAIKILKKMSIAGIKKDIIILDPPAFVKSSQKVREALRGYKEINLRALKMITPGGFLITCSCSHFLKKEDFLNVVFEASLDARRRIKLLNFRFQSYDHAILFPLYQSEYHKCGLFYVY